ncbi:MAG: hypothetical protein QOH79_3620 [Acidimicrobiaceae bacterium]
MSLAGPREPNETSQPPHIPFTGKHDIVYGMEYGDDVSGGCAPAVTRT